MGVRTALVVVVAALLVTTAPAGAESIPTPSTVAAHTTVAALEGVTAPIPFSMVGFTIEPGTTLWFRTSLDGRAWTPWREAEALPEDPVHTEPEWVGAAHWIETTAPATAHLIDSAGLGRGLLDQALDAVRAAWSGPGALASPAGPPGMVSRSGWGADESWRNGPPRYSAQVAAGALHHTAGSNAYGPADTPAILRGIYRYHTGTLGWDDIGYHLLVDRFGRVYEGRAGGVDRPVIGAHAGGFNTDTFGIAVLGTFTAAAPPAGALDAVVGTVAWKLGLHRVDPRGHARLTSRGSSRYPAGQEVTVPTFFGHRDVSRTACPGDALYPLLPDLRRRIAEEMPGIVPALGLPLAGDWTGDGTDAPGWFRDGTWVLQTSALGARQAVTFGAPGDVPVIGDWNGDGRDSIGVRRGTEWLLVDEPRSGAPDRHFHFGSASDTPVAGDWNRDGRDGVGVYRAGTWHLRHTADGGPAQATARFGRAGDVPVPGDWNGNGQDTPALARGGEWLQRNRLGNGPPDRRFTHGDGIELPVVGRWLPGRPDGVGVVNADRWRLRSEVAGFPVITSRRWGS